MIRALLVLLVLTVPATAQDEAQVRKDCTADALRFCKSAIPRGRSAIIACMLNNRHRLQAKCSRHLY